MADDRLRQLRDRSQYLAAFPELTGDRPDGYRWAIIRIWRINSAGVIAAEPDAELMMYIDFLFQEASKIDRERVQIMPTSVDGGKAWFFDREIRQYVFQGFLYDIPEESDGLSDEERRHRGYAYFNRLYEVALRASQAIRKRLIIELDMSGFRLWGFLTNKAGIHAADSPVLYAMTFGFYVEAIQPKVVYDNFNIYQISNESGRKLGLLPVPEEQIALSASDLAAALRDGPSAIVPTASVVQTDDAVDAALQAAEDRAIDRFTRIG